MVRPKSKGRQKIKMEKIEKESNLHVAFSKRRSSVFRNANELCTMTGAEIAVLVFSPGNKAYSFGNPSFQPLITKYKNAAFEPEGSCFLQPQRITQMEKMSNDIALLQKRVEDVKQMEKSRGNGEYLMEAPLESFTFDELETMKVVLEDLRKGVRVQISDFQNQNVSQNSSFIHQPNQLGGIGQSISMDGFQFAAMISNTSNGVGQIGQSITLDGFQFAPAVNNTLNGVGQIGRAISLDDFQLAPALNNTSNGVGQIGQSISLDDFQFASALSNGVGQIGQSISLDGFQFAPAMNNTSNGVGQIGQSISLDDFQFAQALSNGVGKIGQSISLDGFQFTPAVNNTSNGVGQIGQSISLDSIQFARAVNNTSNDIGQSLSMDDGFQFTPAVNNMSNGIGQSISMGGFQFAPEASNTSNGVGGISIPGSGGFGGFVQLPDNAYNLGSGPYF